MTGKTAVFRASASTKIGGGHIVRCMALARELTARDWRCIFACGLETKSTIPMIAEFETMEIDESNPSIEPHLIREGLGQDVPVLVVDHYERGEAFETACRSWAGAIAVIDDLANRRHDADLLLDQSGGRVAEAYIGLVPENCDLKVGPAYSLLRHRFSELSKVRKPRPCTKGPRIFVSMGSTDENNLSEAVVATVLSSIPNSEIDLLLSAHAPHLGKLRTAFAEIRNVTIHVNVPEPADIMVHASFAVGTAGINLWERCALGIPSLIHVAASNQRSNADHVVAYGGGISIGEGPNVEVKALADALADIMSSGDRLRRLSDAASRICDGHGANRLANEIERITMG